MEKYIILLFLNYICNYIIINSNGIIFRFIKNFLNKIKKNYEN